MRAKSFEGMACSIAMVLDAVGDRWAMLVLRDLVLGLRRYDDLRRSTGITNATLADRLKLLEQNGLIERSLYQSAPERYEYLPTARAWTWRWCCRRWSGRRQMAGAGVRGAAAVHRQRADRRARAAGIGGRGQRRAGALPGSEGGGRPRRG